MEVSTKERLTGALIFVAAVIIIVPEMFSGPGPQPAGPVAAPADSAEAGPPLRTFSMTLDDSAPHAAAPAATAAPVVAAAQPVAPDPALPAAPVTPQTPTSSAAAPTAQLPAVPTRDTTVAATKSTPAATVPATPAAGGNWWLRIGLFKSRDNAERLAKKLRTAGYTIDLDKQSVGGKDMARVRAGPVRDRAEALALQERLKAAGTDSMLLPP